MMLPVRTDYVDGQMGLPIVAVVVNAYTFRGWKLIIHNDIRG